MCPGHRAARVWTLLCPPRQLSEIRPSIASRRAIKVLYCGGSGSEAGAWVWVGGSFAGCKTLPGPSYRRQVTGHPCRPVTFSGAADGGPNAGASNWRFRLRCRPDSDTPAPAPAGPAHGCGRARLRSGSYYRRHRAAGAPQHERRDRFWRRHLPLYRERWCRELGYCVAV